MISTGLTTFHNKQRAHHDVVRSACVAAVLMAGLEGWDPPLDPDSEDEFEGEEFDEDLVVWRAYIWRNHYDFCSGAPARCGLPSGE